MKKTKRLWSWALTGAMAVSNLGALAFPMTAMAASYAVNYHATGIGTFDETSKTVTNADVYAASLAATTKVVADVTECATLGTGGNETWHANKSIAAATNPVTIETVTNNGTVDIELEGYTAIGFSATGGKVSDTLATTDTAFGAAVNLANDVDYYPVWKANDNQVTYAIKQADIATLSADLALTKDNATPANKYEYKSGNKITAVTLEDLLDKNDSTELSAADKTAIENYLDANQFLGWDMDGTTSTIEVTDGGSTAKKFAGAATLTAVFKAYGVATLNIGASATSAVGTTIYADADGKLTLPTGSDVYWNGHTLTGWATAAGMDPAYTPGQIITQTAPTATYYAVWADDNYTMTITLKDRTAAPWSAVTEDAANYSIAGTAPGDFTIEGVKLGDKIDLSKIKVTSTGKALLGWSKDENKATPDYTGEVELTVASGFLTDTSTSTATSYAATLYPVYEDGFTVSYVDATGAGTATDGTTAGTAITTDEYVTNNVYTNSKSVTVLDYPDSKKKADFNGRTFMGWAVKKTGAYTGRIGDADAIKIIDGDSTATGIFVGVGDEILVGDAPFNGNITLAPVYLSEYAITFNGNGYTSGKMDALTVNYGDELTLPENGFVKEGQAFDHWYADATTGKYEGKSLVVGPAPNETVIPDGATITDITGALGFTAYWREPAIFKLTFVANGGSGTMDVQEITEQAGDKITKCTFTAPAGKKFGGWATTATGSVVYADEATTEDITEATTLFAIWVDDSEAAKAEAIAAANAAADAAVANPTDATIAAAKAAVEAAKAAGATDDQLKAANDKIAQAEAAKAAADEAAKKAADGSQAKTPAPVGTELKDASGKATGFKVTDANPAAPEVEFVGPADKDAKSVDIPEVQKDLSGNEYKVTSIAPEAFKDSKAKTVTIRKNIKKIDPNAFKNSKVKNVKIKGTKLSKKMAKAFKKLKKGGKITCSGSNKKKNKKYLSALKNVKNGNTKLK